MLKFKFTIHDQSELAKTTLANIHSLADDIQNQLAKIRIIKGESSWNFEVEHMFIKRNKAEMDLVFGDRQKVNLISKLLGHEVRLTETVRTRFSGREVKPEYELDFFVPEELDREMGSIELEFSVDQAEFPYLKQFHLVDMKPWETWKDVLLRQSKETQERVFLTAITDSTGYDCEQFAKLTTDEERVVYLFDEMVSPDLREFFVEKFKGEDVSQIDIFGQIINRANSVEHLNKIFKKTEEEAQ